MLLESVFFCCNAVIAKRFPSHHMLSETKPPFLHPQRPWTLTTTRCADNNKKFMFLFPTMLTEYLNLSLMTLQGTRRTARKDGNKEISEELM